MLFDKPRQLACPTTRQDYLGHQAPFFYWDRRQQSPLPPGSCHRWPGSPLPAVTPARSAPTINNRFPPAAGAVSPDLYYLVTLEGDSPYHPKAEYTDKSSIVTIRIIDNGTRKYPKGIR